MYEPLDPQLSQLFSNYSPTLDATFLAQLQAALDSSERRARWRVAASWTAVVVMAGTVATLASGPLESLAAVVNTAARNTLAETTVEMQSMQMLVPFSITPLTLTLVTALIALFLHRRIRAMLVP